MKAPLTFHHFGVDRQEQWPVAIMSKIAAVSKPGIDATKKIPGEGFKRAWPPLIKMDEAVKAKVESILKTKI